MEIVSIGLLIAIVYLLQNNKSHYTSQIERLESRIIDLQQSLKQDTNKKSVEPTPTSPVNKPDEVKRPEPLTPQPVPRPPVVEKQHQIITAHHEAIPQPARTPNTPEPQSEGYKKPVP